jgi:hypothetical protein
VTDLRDIETYLLNARGWVKAAQLSEVFGVRERALRSEGAEPGLCSAFAISGDKGLKHVRNATTDEWLRFKHRLRRHGVGELIRVRSLQHRRREISDRRPGFQVERDTGQVLLF